MASYLGGTAVGVDGSPGERRGEVGHREGHEQHGGGRVGQLGQHFPGRAAGVAAATGGDQQLGRLDPCRGRRSGVVALARTPAVRGLGVGLRADGVRHPRPDGARSVATRLPHGARVHADEAVTHEDRLWSQGNCFRDRGRNEQLRTASSGGPGLTTSQHLTGAV